MQYNPRKRQLFRSLASAETITVRPPWAVADYDFVAKCTGCHRCQDVCQESIIARDHRSQPIVDFEKGECSFCGDCVAVCPSGALDREAVSVPWLHKVRFSNKCLADHNSYCRSCAEVCEQEAIFFTLTAGAMARPQLQADLCHGCGACISVCPTRAIQINETEKEVA